MATKIPENIDAFLFNDLRAFYRNGQNVDQNLHNDDTANRRYLGTYFPRSMDESFQIFNNLYENKTIKNTFLNKDTLKILDVGTGTGGNIIGVLYFLKKHNIQKHVEIITIEGNPIAIEYQNKSNNWFNHTHKTNYTLRCIHHTFNLDYFDSELRTIVDRLHISFDMITSFKFLSEFYNLNYSKAKGLYEQFAKIGSNYIKSDGIILILDLVSGTFDHSNKRPFTTQIISNELNGYIQNPSSKLAYILPVCCSMWSKQCKTTNCYTERQFRLSHSRKKNDISKVTYRILARKNFAQKVLSDVEKQEKYQMSFNSYRPTYCNKTKILDYKNDLIIQNGFKFV